MKTIALTPSTAGNLLDSPLTAILYSRPIKRKLTATISGPAKTEGERIHATVERIIDGAAIAPPPGTEDYINDIREEKKKGATVQTEMPIDCSPFFENMQGRADAVVIHGDTLKVFDLKTGSKPYTSADIVQLLIYAYCILSYMAYIKTIVLRIYTAKAIAETTYTRDELIVKGAEQSKRLHDIMELKDYDSMIQTLVDAENGTVEEAGLYDALKQLVNLKGFFERELIKQIEDGKKIDGFELKEADVTAIEPDEKFWKFIDSRLTKEDLTEIERKAPKKQWLRDRGITDEDLKPYIKIGKPSLKRVKD